MLKSDFDTYIARFNAQDATAFDDYLQPDVRVRNGFLEYEGVGGMKEHYQQRIWPWFEERLNPLRYVSDGRITAVDMATNFLARRDGDTLFGPVVAGMQFDYRGLIMYDMRDGKFATITVSYNSFVRTDIDGVKTELGIVH